MVEQFHGRLGTKTSGTGGRRRRFRDKNLSEMGGPFTATKVGEEDVRKFARRRGGSLKVKLKHAAFANVLTKEGMKKVKIRTVVESRDNRHYARQNIITKGAVIDTEIGKVRVTNRVGQDGVVNGILI
ncbi:MAG: 30S ribosomal protein S8e [Candidatus Micrarchaeota archaeon]